MSARRAAHAYPDLGGKSTVAARLASVTVEGLRRCGPYTGGRDEHDGDDEEVNATAEPVGPDPGRALSLAARDLDRRFRRGLRRHAEASGARLLNLPSAAVGYRSQRGAVVRRRDRPRSADPTTQPIFQLGGAERRRDPQRHLRG